MDHRIVVEEVDIAVDGSAMGAHLARPAAPGRYPGIVVGFHLFGLSTKIKDATEHLARLGYVAIAPDFYHRTAPGVELAADDEGRERGFELMRRLTRDEVLHDVRASVEYLRDRRYTTDRTGMLGFSLGGHIAYLAATRLNLAATAVLYGGWLLTDETPLGRPEPTVELTGGIAEHDGRLLFIVGGDDALIDAGRRTRIAERLSAEGVRHEMVVYPDTPHAFFFDGTETYRPTVAADAWDRIRALFADELAEEPAR